ncbi:MAG TPA: hypothetical protein VFP56_03405 [Candidatus Limnocylindrales bacterium]|nr:hypothetical protein [Candidatus Limnocylindrales bacterium]
MNHPPARLILASLVAVAAALPTATPAAALEIPTIQIRLHDSDHLLLANPQVGVPFHPRITLFGSSKTTPVTGSVTVALLPDPACDEFGLTATGQLVNGVFDATSITEIPPTVYQPCISVSYGGDANFAPTSATKTFVVQKGVVTLTHAVHSLEPHQAVTSVALGATVHGWATVAYGGYTPTGSVVVRRFSDGACATPVASVALPVPFDGTVDNASSWTPTRTGTFAYGFAFEGDARYEPVAELCRSFVVSRAKPTFTENVLTSASGEAVADGSTVPTGIGYGQRVTLSGAAGPVAGKVWLDAFEDSGTCSGTPTSFGVTLTSAGTATGSFVGRSTPGEISYHARYEGNATYAAVTSTCLRLKVKSPVQSVLVETHAGNGHTPEATFPTGEPLHARVRVNVTGVAPTGKLTGRIYANGTCGSAPILTLSATGGADKDPVFSWPAGSVGRYSVRVEYGGDGSYLPKASDCWSYAITQADPDVATDVHDAAHAPVTGVMAGGSVHLAVSVSGVAGPASGMVTVRFFGNGTCSGVPAGSLDATLVAGRADVTGLTRTLAEGPYAFAWTYGGDGRYRASSGGCRSVVGLAAGATPPPPTAAPSKTAQVNPSPAPGSSFLPLESPAAAPSIDPRVSADPAATGDPAATIMPGSTAPLPSSGGPRAVAGASLGPDDADTVGATGALPVAALGVVGIGVVGLLGLVGVLTRRRRGA